jgi:hypothetical protein
VFLRSRYEIKLTANSCIVLCSSIKRSQLFIGAHDEAFLVAMRVNNPNRSPFNI